MTTNESNFMAALQVSLDAACKHDAVGILDRMLEVVDNDMLAHIAYVSREVVRPDLAEQGAVCAGYRVCAIGSLYMAAGIEPENVSGLWFMPDGIYPDFREEFMRDKPALALAYDALNNAATEYVEAHDLRLDLEAWGTDNELEALFETNLTGEDDSLSVEPSGYLIEPHELRPVIVRAKELIHEQATS